MNKFPFILLTSEEHLLVMIVSDIGFSVIHRDGLDTERRIQLILTVYISILSHLELRYDGLVNSPEEFIKS